MQLKGVFQNDEALEQAFLHAQASEAQKDT